MYHFIFFYFYASEWLTLSKIIQSAFILLETVLLDLYDSFIGNIILQDITIKAFSPIVYLQTCYDNVPHSPPHYPYGVVLARLYTFDSILWY